MSLFAQLNATPVAVRPEGSASSSSFEKKPSKFFQPGTYELKITEVTNHGPSKQDATWLYFILKAEDVNGRKLVQQLMVPTQSLVCAKDPKSLNEMRLRSALRALGFDGSEESLKKDVVAAFENSAKLVGKTINVELGYSAAHSGWDKEAKKPNLIDRDGNVMTDSTGAPLLFENSDEVAAYCEQQKIFFQKFVEVRKWLPAAKAVKKTGFGK